MRQAAEHQAHSHFILSRRAGDSRHICPHALSHCAGGDNRRYDSRYAGSLEHMLAVRCSVYLIANQMLEVARAHLRAWFPNPSSQSTWPADAGSAL